MSKGKVFLILVILAAVIFFLFGSKKERSVSFIEEENVVLVADQLPGEEVTVSYVKLDEPGYVSVYAKNANGVEEFVGNSAFLPAGEHTNVSVKLTKKVISGNLVNVKIVKDNGDEVFEEGTEEVVLDSNGEELSFEIEISEEAPNQEDISLVDLAEEAGYEVNEESDLLDDEDTMMGDEVMDDEMSDDSNDDNTGSDDEMMDDTTEDDSEEVSDEEPTE